MPLNGTLNTYNYDEVGNLTSVEGCSGNWYYTYNNRGKVTSIISNNYNTSTITYAANNVDVISINDYFGEERRSYNDSHDVTSITDRLGNTTTFNYNVYGQASSVQDALGIFTNYVYDAGHRLVAATREGHTLNQYNYDGLDRVRTHTDATGLTRTYDYNELDQVTRITYPDGKFESYQYSTCCPFKVDSSTERSGQTTFYSYDQANRLTAVTDPAGGVTRFTYDANGNRTSLIDRKGNTTSFQYDFNNRIVKKTYANGIYELFNYDNASSKASYRTDPRGFDTYYGYAPFNKIRFMSTMDPQTYEFISYDYFDYDDYGRMTWATSSSIDYGYSTYIYNANHLMSVEGPWRDYEGNPVDIVTYQYDNLGRRVGMTRQNGQSVSYTYDNLHRLTSVSMGDQVYTYGYTGASPLVRSLTRANGSVTTYDYDVLNRLTLMTTKVGEMVVNSYGYTYNAQDLRGSETAIEAAPPVPYTNELVNYTYNNVNELTQTNDPEAKTLIYDASGNLTQGYTPEGYVFNAIYDPQNRLTSLSYMDGSGTVNKTGYFYLGNTVTVQSPFLDEAFFLKK